jgi:hypothetical protein
MKQDLGNAVLLDNSTVYGAMEAYQTSPQQLLRGEGVGPGSAAAKFHALMGLYAIRRGERPRRLAVR